MAGEEMTYPRRNHIEKVAEISGTGESAKLAVRIVSRQTYNHAAMKRIVSHIKYNMGTRVGYS
jgi:hypothetical protein